MFSLPWSSSLYYSHLPFSLKGFPAKVLVMKENSWDVRFPFLRHAYLTNEFTH